jgi:hypothetical protein
MRAGEDEAAVEDDDDEAGVSYSCRIRIGKILETQGEFIRIKRKSGLRWSSAREIASRTPGASRLLRRRPKVGKIGRVRMYAA